jgi:hypothetical protein
VPEHPGGLYGWAVSAVAAIGVGAFAVSFLALRDLMGDIGYSSATAWIFPAIIDTAVAVSTLMLVALGDKPARRTRTMTTPADIQTSVVGLTPDGGHLTGGTSGPAGRLSVCRASVRSTPRSSGSRLPAW